MIVAGGIYFGCIDPDKPCELSDELIKKPNEFVYEQTSFGFRSLLDSLIAYEQNGILPLAGGLLEQPPLFLDAAKIFSSSRQIFKNQKNKNAEMLRRLGALK